jgi:RNA polymerase sigma-70 factor (ECF subfamily)
MGRLSAIRSEDPSLRGNLQQTVSNVLNMLNGDPALAPAMRAMRALADACGESSIGADTQANLLAIVAAEKSNQCFPLLSLASIDNTGPDKPLLQLAHKLTRGALIVRKSDIDEVRSARLGDDSILKVIHTIALGQMLCTLLTGLSPSPTSPIVSRSVPTTECSENIAWTEPDGPYFPTRTQPPAQWPPFAFLRTHFGFVPRIYQEQMICPNLVQAQVQLLEDLLISRGPLARTQKELVLLAVSAANRNTYFVTVHGQILSTLGVPHQVSTQIAEDNIPPSFPNADRALLEEVRNLGCQNSGRPVACDLQRLRVAGFNSAEITEAVAIAAFTNFLNTLQAGLGTIPDFAPLRSFSAKDLYRFGEPPRHIPNVESQQDPDAEFVARVKRGDTDAFEELVRRNSGRVFGTLAGLLGNPEDARDATQDVFLKAFENIGRFEGRSRFSTWVTSIAINAGTDMLRRRKPSDSLTEADGEEGYRPRQIQSWVDNPEQFLAASQRANLVREGVLRLPEKYRLAVLLRDINQVSNEEAATALGISLPALKARVLRGRLMLRETLTPHFSRKYGGGNADLR